MRFVLATSNAHKEREYKSLLSAYAFEAVKGICVSEDCDSYEGNSLLKLNALLALLRDGGKNADSVCFADDSGIEIEAFGGGPGVRSSRFHPELSQHDRNALVVDMVKSSGKRKARFVCCISFAKVTGSILQVTGVCNGRILDDKTAILRTDRDFGYDPIFIPDGFDRPFNALGVSIKNAVSHRALAVKAMLDRISGGSLQGESFVRKA